MDKNLEIVPVEPKLNEELLKYFKGEKDGYVQVGPKKWFLPIKYQRLAKEYQEFEVRQDDVWVLGIPRSGTTVTQYIVWALTHDLQYDYMKEKRPVKFFENYLVMNDKTIEQLMKVSQVFRDRLEDESQNPKNNIKHLNEMTDRRVIKSHFSFDLLPKGILESGCKLVYVCREPRDVIVSYYHLQKQLPHIKFEGDLEKYFEFYLNGNIMFGPYFEHVKQAWENRHLDNVLFLFYEDLRKDPRGYIERICKFLEKPLTDVQMDEMMEEFKIEAVKKIDTDGIEFVRKGKVGGWTEFFNEDMCRAADEWIRRHVKEIGIEYPS